MDTCDVCKRASYHGRNYTLCSNFCAETTDADKAKWLAMQPGDWGYYPCAECGCVMEDEYSGPGAICSDCHPRVQLRKSNALLEETVRILSEVEEVSNGVHELLPIIMKIREHLKP